MGKWSGSPGRVGPARVFREFAVASGAFFASAEIQRGMDWSGQGLGYGPETERTIYLAPGGRWCGLPPHPVWWSWYFPVYQSLVQPYLTKGSVRVDDTGLFHEWQTQPANRDESPLGSLTRRESGCRRNSSRRSIPRTHACSTRRSAELR